ncbi:hypothetical protein PALB_21540 [Pseudoalteromonas luteoviolacea B = ATCC 29581]|nr:hypothetical protein PALB_21540 [Pseudoalteromonas luteoviolacea B = ATCC 29581]
MPIGCSKERLIRVYFSIQNLTSGEVKLSLTHTPQSNKPFWVVWLSD